LKRCWSSDDSRIDDPEAPPPSDAPRRSVNCAFPNGTAAITNADWLARVDAANLIINVCGSLSEHRAPFAKKGDSLFLLRHILERDREQLAPLRDYVASLVTAVAPAEKMPN
jgi:hypothetical protein